jgi:hypothetical protein
MARAWVLAVTVAILAVQFATSSQHGFQANCVNDQCYVVAATSLPGLIASAVLAAFVYLYPQPRHETGHTEPIKLWKRGVAFYVDFWIALSITAPAATLPLLFEEGRFTGDFRWSFERDFARSTDAALAVPAILIMFVVLFLYFYLHLRLQRQTIGQYLMGFRVEPEAGTEMNAFSVVALSWIGMCMWPFALYGAAKHPQKLFWWNEKTRTRVVQAAP